MITRSFPTILEAWHGVIDELAYDAQSVGAIGKGGITTSYPDMLCVEVDNALVGDNLHLDMSSYGKNRWTSFLRRYFRHDLSQWVTDTTYQLSKLNKHQVAGYEVNPNPEFEQIGRKGYGSSSKGHRHGACLASLQIQMYPFPRVILVSRASMVDKAGFLDMALIHLVAKQMNDTMEDKLDSVRATWICSMAFIAAVVQMFHVRRFRKKLKGHSLEKSTRRFWHDNYEDAKYGPQKRSIKKAQEFLKHGTILRSCPVSELSLEFNPTKAERRAAAIIAADDLADADD